MDTCYVTMAICLLKSGEYYIQGLLANDHTKLVIINKKLPLFVCNINVLRRINDLIVQISKTESFDVDQNL